MAKDKVETRGKDKHFKCRNCGKDFLGERAERAKHEQTAHAGWTPPAAGKGKSRGKPPVVEKSADALLLEALNKITADLAEKGAALKNVENLRREITALENRRKAMMSLLPADLRVKAAAEAATPPAE